MASWRTKSKLTHQLHPFGTISENYHDYIFNRGKRILSLGKLGTTWTGLAGAQELRKRKPRSALAVSNASRRRRRRYLGYQTAWIRVRKANNPKGEKKSPVRLTF
uniref:(northern house mosquito) hypothetical protein n=1 Tax=Culex pipiens TaxID=7175 RepID=A0A8D8BBH4_CULPI